METVQIVHLTMDISIVDGITVTDISSGANVAVTAVHLLNVIATKKEVTHG